MYFSPESTGSAPYTTDVAYALSEAGLNVRVITTAPHYPQWRRWTGYRTWWSVEKAADVTVYRVPCFVPRHPNAVSRLLYELSFLLASIPVLLAQRRPRLVIGTTPNLFSALMARGYSVLTRTPLMQMVQDLVSSGASQAAGGGRVMQGALGRLERAALLHAASITVAAPSFREALLKMGVPAEAVHHVPNWIRDSDEVESLAAEHPRDRFRALGNRVLVLHTGNMGQKQGLEQFVETVAVTRQLDQYYFAFVGDGSRRLELERAAQGVPNVAVLPPVAQADYAALLAAADVLLVNERDTVRDMSLPSKLTAYLHAAKPIVAVVHPHGATAHEVLRSGAGRIVPTGNGACLAAALRELQDPEVARRCAANARRYATLLTPEPLLARIINLVLDLIR